MTHTLVICVKAAPRHVRLGPLVDEPAIIEPVGTGMAEGTIALLALVLERRRRGRAAWGHEAELTRATAHTLLMPLKYHSGHGGSHVVLGVGRESHGAMTVAGLPCGDVTDEPCPCVLSVHIDLPYFLWRSSAIFKAFCPAGLSGTTLAVDGSTVNVVIDLVSVRLAAFTVFTPSPLLRS